MNKCANNVSAVSQDAERIESAKAGAVAAVGGLLGSLPYLAAQGQSQLSTALSAAQVVASCLLFGVTFRYVQSAGAGNPQLKAGTVAAFGMVPSFPLCPKHLQNSAVIADWIVQRTLGIRHANSSAEDTCSQCLLHFVGPGIGASSAYMSKDRLAVFNCTRLVLCRYGAWHMQMQRR